MLVLANIVIQLVPIVWLTQAAISAILAATLIFTSCGYHTSCVSGIHSTHYYSIWSVTNNSRILDTQDISLLYNISNTSNLTNKTLWTC